MSGKCLILAFMRKILLGLGGNIGDREAALHSAREALAAWVSEMRCSAIYEFPALLDADAPQEWNQPFLNQVVCGVTALEPLALLEQCQRIEQQIGKRKIGHWAPRLIDIDILDMQDVQLVSERLTIPHPEMHKRDFVMQPLLELCPDYPQW